MTSEGLRPRAFGRNRAAKGLNGKTGRRETAAKKLHRPPEPATKGYAEINDEVLNLALMKLRDPLAYRLALPAASKFTGLKPREIEQLVRPIYERRAAAEAAELGDGATPGQRDQVHEIGLGCTLLFCDADRVAYATIEAAGHRETWPVRSERFRQYLIGEFQRRHGRLAAGTALGEGIEAIAAAAAAGGSVDEVCVRLGGNDGKIYLDLCRDDWKVVEIDAGGWRVLDSSPVPFLRVPGQRPLPIPCRQPGGLARLRTLVNIADEDEDDWILYVTFLVAGLRPRGPYLILVLNGEPGAIKSSMTRTARRLIDPAMVLIAAPPTSEEDLVVVAKNNRLVAFDNLSSINDELPTRCAA
jgi:hypothetical protein